MKTSVLVLLSFVIAGCAAYRAQHGGTDYSRPVAPAATGDMDLGDDELPAPASARRVPAEPSLVSRFAQQPLAVKQATIQAQLDALKADLAASGNYSCCVRPSCNECAINSGECHCSRVVAANGPCCGECTQAWIEGRGIVEGVDREQILEHLGCVRELYEKPLPPGETMPGALKPVKDR